MPKSAVFAALCLAGLAGPALAQSHDAAQTIPDFSGGWARLGDMVETYDVIPGHTGGNPQTVDPKYPHVGATGTAAQWISSLDNPILKPETRAKLKAITEYDIQGISHIKDEGVCT